MLQGTCFTFCTKCSFGLQNELMNRFCRSKVKVQGHSNCMFCSCEHDSSATSQCSVLPILTVGLSSSESDVFSTCIQIKFQMAENNLAF